MTDAETNPSTTQSSRGASHPRHPRFLAEDKILSAHSPFTSTERFVGLTLLHYLNRAGCAWPSKETLSAACGISPRTVQTALRGLCGGPHALFRRDLRRRGTPLYTIQGEQILLPLERPRGANHDIQGEQITTSKGSRFCSHNMKEEQPSRTRENAVASVDVVGKASTGQPPQARTSTPIENNGAADPTLRRVRERQAQVLAEICQLSKRTTADELGDASQTARGRRYRAVEGCPTTAWGRASLDRLEARLEDLGAAQRPVEDDIRYTPEEAERVRLEILAKRPAPISPSRPSETQTVVPSPRPEPPTAEPVRWAERVRGRMNGGGGRAQRPTRLSDDLRALKRPPAAGVTRASKPPVLGSGNGERDQPGYEE